MKIECDELIVICDNCGHAIHVKELDNNLIKLNNKNDKLISEQAAIDALIEWYGCEPNGMDYFKEILAKKSPAQPEREWIPCSIPPKHHRDVIVRGTELIGYVTVHKVMQWDVDTWRPTDYAPSIRWDEWSEI